MEKRNGIRAFYKKTLEGGPLPAWKVRFARLFLNKAAGIETQARDEPDREKISGTLKKIPRWMKKSEAPGFRRKNKTVIRKALIILE